jgi:two-component system alkaline phosphatase synthesis response regulator PhoP
MLPRVLQAQDDEDLRLSLWGRLRQGGYSVETAADGLEGLTKAIAGGFHVLILDAALPQVSGLDVCRALRRAGYDIPILLLVDCSQTNGKIAALRMGADDCLTKPVDIEEVFLRVQALLRRSSVVLDPASSYCFGPIRVEFRRTEVFRDDTLLDLSAKEFHLLRYFITNRGATLSRQTLLREVWAYRSTPSTRTVDVHVSWLRQKLEDDPKLPRWIITVHGMGYKFLG